MAHDVRRAAHLAQGFRRMVAQEAWRVWRRLPAHTKVWVSPEDMIEDGMWYVISEAIPKWSPKRGALSTLIFRGIHNFYDEHYYHKLVVSKKRNERLVTSMEEIVAHHNKYSRERALEIELYNECDLRSAERMQRECFVVPLLMRVYRQASVDLQEEMQQWFLGLGRERARFDTTKFGIVSREFQKLARKSGLDIEDCRHLFVSPVCLDELSRELRWVPYDLERPTPRLTA